MNKETGFRLPTINELSAMINRETNDKVEGLNDSYYWSSTDASSNSSDKWVVDMKYGHVFSFNRPVKLSVLYVRGDGDTLEIVTNIDEKMGYNEAVEYASCLTNHIDDSIKLKLNRLHYEVEPIKLKKNSLWHKFSLFKKSMKGG